MNYIYVKFKRLVFNSSFRIFILLSRYKLLIKFSWLTKCIIYFVRFGYGNLPWTAREDYIFNLIKFETKVDNSIIELGSGLTTLILSAITKKDFLSLENNYEFFLNTQKYLKKFKLNESNLRYSQLKDYGDFEWYNISKLKIPNRLDLIICDGPPSTTKGGRLGIIKILNLLSVGGFIIMDDANRKGEQKVIKYIKKNFKEYKSFNLDKSTVLLKKT
tara:strand:+ start:71 stop:721 length:651 start_codon:yes stop_codon:yes gene_type:complete